MKYRNDQKGENESREEKAAGLFIKLPWIRPVRFHGAGLWLSQNCLFQSLCSFLRKPVGLRWFKNLTNTWWAIRTILRPAFIGLLSQAPKLSETMIDFAYIIIFLHFLWQSNLDAFQQVFMGTPICFFRQSSFGLGSPPGHHHPPLFKRKVLWSQILLGNLLEGIFWRELL